VACEVAAPHATPLFYSFGGGLGFGCVGDPDGLVFGVSGGVGFADGGGGTSGDELGIDGDVGGGGVCCAQAAAIALSAMTARVDLVAFILHSSIEKKSMFAIRRR